MLSNINFQYGVMMNGRLWLSGLLALLMLAGCAPQKQSQPVSEKSSAAETDATRPNKATDQREIALPPQIGIAERSDVHAFIMEMVQRHGFDAGQLSAAFDAAGFQPAILEAMGKPYEAKPWFQYQKLFLTEKRILGGRTFMEENRAVLSRIQTKYGVDPAIVTAIIGIESAYGVKPGKYRLIDALSTLAFQYPRRASFFRSELEQFLLLCREEGTNPVEPLGSYAGAMGMPQFMPSSFRKLAVDGDGDGRRDIWKNPSDAIASVANYFSRNGWRTGEPIAVPANVKGTAFGAVLSSKTPKPSFTLSQLAAKGVTPAAPVKDGLKGVLVELPGDQGPVYWIVFQNFSVIMRYNHSVLYAMAAYELTRSFQHAR